MKTRQVILLDSVRGVAAQAVLLQHAMNLSGMQLGLGRWPLGAFGVMIFFVLSGFLIGHSLRTRAGTGYSLDDYLCDRFCRLYVCFVPALVFTALVVASVIDNPAFPVERHAGVTQFVGNLLMLQDYPLFQITRRVGLDAPWFIRPYALSEPYWTIPIEFWLYVAAGVVVFVGVLRSTRPTLIVLVLAAVAAVPVLYHMASGAGQCLALVWLLGALGAFGIELPARVQQRLGLAPRARMHLIVGWIGLALLLFALRAASRGVDFRDFQTALFVSALLMGLFWLCGELPEVRGKAFGFVASLTARLSYPLYLVHNVIVGWFVIQWARPLTGWEFAVLLVVCNLVAWLFWWLFDRHYRRVAKWMRSLPRPPLWLAAQNKPTQVRP